MRFQKGYATLHFLKKKGDTLCKLIGLRPYTFKNFFVKRSLSVPNSLAYLYRESIMLSIGFITIILLTDFVGRGTKKNCRDTHYLMDFSFQHY